MLPLQKYTRQACNLHRACLDIVIQMRMKYFIQTEKSRRMRPPEPNPRVQTGSVRCNRLPKLCCTSAYRQVFFRRAPCFCLENAFLSASSCCNSNICVSRSNQSPRCNSVFSERVYMPWFNLEFLSQAVLPKKRQCFPKMSIIF